MFTYSEVEKVLTHMYKSDVYTYSESALDNEKEFQAFRARIKTFQKLGITPASPGKGKRLLYNFLDIAKWATCFELSEFGMSPLSIKAMIDDLWEPELERYFSYKDNNYILIYTPHLMTLSRFLNSDVRGMILVTTTIEATHENQYISIPATARRCLILGISEIRRNARLAIEEVLGADRLP